VCGEAAGYFLAHPLFRLIRLSFKLKMTLFGEISGSDGGEYEDGCLLGDLIALMMEAASTYETSLNFYQTTRHNNPEGSHLRDFLCVFS
jgi:hypothetical protein